MQQNVLQRVPFWKIVVGWLFWIVVIGVLVFALVKWGVPAISRGAQSLFAQANQPTPAAKETVVAKEVTKVIEQTKVVEVTKVIEQTRVIEKVATSAPTSVPATVTLNVTPQVSNPTTSALGASSTTSLTATYVDSRLASNEAWHAENQANGEAYGKSPIGGLGERRGIAGQLWTRVHGYPERIFFYIPPGSIAWIQGHLGGTAWWVDPNGDILAELQKQWNDLVAREGQMTSTIIILPRDEEAFKTTVLVELQSAAVTMAVTPATTTLTPTPTSAAPKPLVAATATVAIQAASGKCNIGAESVGPAILEGEVNGKTTVIKLNAGSKFVLAAGGCFPFLSQAALDARWPDHKAEFLKKYPAGQAIEK